MSGFLRIILIIAVGVAFYWYYSKRRAIQPGQAPDLLSWQPIFRDELPALKSAVPVGYYVNLLALSKSRIPREECVARLDEIVAKMKEEDTDSQAVATLILKLEQDTNIH